jgi:non-ribosomal peptide synthetase component F
VCQVTDESGTTGKPKGVDVTHRNVANLVCQAPGNLDVRPGTCVGSILNISFDMGKSMFEISYLPREWLWADVGVAAAWEIFTCLCNGGTLVVRGSKWEPALEQVSLIL